MRIAFYSKHLPSDSPNGVSVQVHRLANELVRTGHAVTCFSFSPKPADALYTVTQLDFGSSRRLVRKFMPALRFAGLDRSGFDILHYHGDDYACRGSTRRIRTFYGSALFEAVHAGRFLRSAYQALFYMFEWISSIRRGVKVGISKATCRALPLVRRHISCGVPVDQYIPAPEKTSHPSILFIGDFKSRKRGDLLISAFERTVIPDCKDCILTVVGPASCDKPGVRCLGNIPEDELIRQYQKNWILCVPSSYEGFGVPAIEAMACGAVVVAADNAGIREIVTDGENGLLCRPSNLGKILLQTIKDPALRKKLVEKALNAVVRYDIRTIAQNYVKEYAAIISRSA